MGVQVIELTCKQRLSVVTGTQTEIYPEVKCLARGMKIRDTEPSSFLLGSLFSFFTPPTKSPTPSQVADHFLFQYLLLLPPHPHPVRCHLLG